MGLTLICLTMMGRMKKLLLLILFTLSLVSVAAAATPVTRYVNTDCANNGDGTASSCAGSPGGAGAYTTAQNAMTDIAADYPSFVASDVVVTVNCRGVAADTSELDITGITTDATRYIQFISDASSRHSGVWSTSDYRIANGGYEAAVRIRNNFARVEFIQIEQNKTGAGGGTPASGIAIDISGATSGFVYIGNNIFRYTGDYTNQDAVAVRDTFNETSGVTKVFVNNLAYDWKGGFYLRTQPTGQSFGYNNTCYSNQSGSACFTYRPYGAGGTMDVINNIANGTLTGYDTDTGSSTLTTNNNISEDTTSPNVAYRSLPVIFVNEGADNFDLDVSDTSAQGEGVDLSAATQGFSIDIREATRGATWDIGAFQITGVTPTPTPTPTPSATPTPTPTPPSYTNIIMLEDY